MKNTLEETNNKYLLGKNDSIFKAIFCNVKNDYMMLEFLKRLVRKDIKNITILNNELNIEDKEEKKKMVDVLVKADGNTLYHIELNTKYTFYIRIRNFIYACKVYSTYARKGKEYNTNLKFVHIDLTYGLSSKKSWLRNFMMKDCEENKIHIPNFKMMEYNMDKITTYWYNENRNKVKKLRYLIMLGLEKDELEKLVKEFKEDRFIMKYKEELDWLNENNYGLTTYEEDFELRLNTEIHMLDEKYKRREDKLCQKNRQEGISIGRNQGISIGLSKGRDEGRLEEKNLLAKNMLKDGVEVDKIAKYTNLSKSSIMSLM